MKRSMPGLPVHHQLPEFTETHVHRVSDANQEWGKQNTIMAESPCKRDVADDADLKGPKGY